MGKSQRATTKRGKLDIKKELSRKIVGGLFFCELKLQIYEDKL